MTYGEGHDPKTWGAFLERLQLAPPAELQQYADTALLLMACIDIVFRTRFPDVRANWCTQVRDTALSDPDAVITHPTSQT